MTRGRGICRREIRTREVARGAVAGREKPVVTEGAVPVIATV